jgi:nucleoside-diphosphate-sugar epimerase
MTVLACVRLGTVIGPWERDTGARDNFGTHSQLAAMAVAGRTAVLTAHEIQRDWIYSRDVAEAVATLLSTRSVAHAAYNVSSGVVWVEPIARWCEALTTAFPNFSFRKPVRRSRQMSGTPIGTAASWMWDDSHATPASGPRMWQEKRTKTT